MRSMKMIHKVCNFKKACQRYNMKKDENKKNINNKKHSQKTNDKTIKIMK